MKINGAEDVETRIAGCHFWPGTRVAGRSSALTPYPCCMSSSQTPHRKRVKHYRDPFHSRSLVIFLQFARPVATIGAALRWLESRPCVPGVPPRFCWSSFELHLVCASLHLRACQCPLNQKRAS